MAAKISLFADPVQESIQTEKKDSGESDNQTGHKRKKGVLKTKVLTEYKSTSRHHVNPSTVSFQQNVTTLTPQICIDRRPESNYRQSNQTSAVFLTTQSILYV